MCWVSTLKQATRAYLCFIIHNQGCATCVVLLSEPSEDILFNFSSSCNLRCVSLNFVQVKTKHQMQCCVVSTPE